MQTQVKAVTEINRHATEVLAELRGSHVPAAITEHGEIGAYIALENLDAR